MVTLVFRDGRRKTVHFGSSGYSDYTMHGDSQRKQRYIQRHGPNEKWEDDSTAGFWSRWLLWAKPDLEASIQALPPHITLTNHVSSTV